MEKFIDFKKFKILKIILKIFVIIIISCIIIYFGIKTFIYKTTYIEYIEENCSGSSIDPYLILSIIKVESSFKTNSISSKEAKGLMQIQDSTYTEISNMLSISDSNPYNPETNIKVGIAYFKKLLDKYNGNYYIALLAYNGGMGNVNTWINSGIISNDLNEYIVPEIPFKETRDYLRKVISAYNMYKVLYNL